MLEKIGAWKTVKNQQKFSEHSIIKINRFINKKICLKKKGTWFVKTKECSVSTATSK